MGSKKSSKGSKSIKKPAPKAAAAPKVAARSAAKAPAEGALRGEREALAALREVLPPLSLAESQAFLEPNSPETCRQRAHNTKARDVLRIAVGWARTIGENPSDGAVSPKRARWFLDCTSALAEVVSGNTIVRNPSVTTAETAARAKAIELSAEIRKQANRALGDDMARREQLANALKPEARDARAEALRNTKTLLHGWIKNDGLGLRLGLQDITEETLTELEATAKALDAATANKGAAKQVDRDSPAENEAEGRLLFAMKWIWDDFKAARKKGKSRLVLQVSPAIVRGLGLAKGAGDNEDEDDEEGPGGPTA